MTDQEIISAFHAMWDNFPEPVMITQKSRVMVAVNKKGEEVGLKLGIRCSSIGKPEEHKGCLCNRAIDSRQSVSVKYSGPDGSTLYGYWIPIPERPDWVIHFGVGRMPVYEDLRR